MDNLPPLTAVQARAIDRYAVEQLGLPSIVLMENAAINAASVILDLLEDITELDEDRYRVGIVCGGGNNAGDGYATARHLHGFNTAVALYAHKPLASLTGDAAINARCCQQLGLPIAPCQTPDDLKRCAAQWPCCHILVDALLGTGFAGPVRPATAAVIHALNATPTPGSSVENLPDNPANSPATANRLRPHIVALDVPSGLDADTGRTTDATVRADTTVTFVAPKAGFAHPDAAAHLGRVITADIGLPTPTLRAALAHQAKC